MGDHKALQTVSIASIVGSGQKIPSLDGHYLTRLFLMENWVKSAMFLR